MNKKKLVTAAAVLALLGSAMGTMPAQAEVSDNDFTALQMRVSGLAQVVNNNFYGGGSKTGQSLYNNESLYKNLSAFQEEQDAYNQNVYTQIVSPNNNPHSTTVEEWEVPGGTWKDKTTKEIALDGTVTSETTTSTKQNEYGGTTTVISGESKVKTSDLQSFTRTTVTAENGASTDILVENRLNYTTKVVSKEAEDGSYVKTTITNPTNESNKGSYKAQRTWNEAEGSGSSFEEGKNSDGTISYGSARITEENGTVTEVIVTTTTGDDGKAVTTYEGYTYNRITGSASVKLSDEAAAEFYNKAGKEVTISDTDLTNVTLMDVTPVAASLNYNTKTTGNLQAGASESNLAQSSDVTTASASSVTNRRLPNATSPTNTTGDHELNLNSKSDFQTINGNKAVLNGQVWVTGGEAYTSKEEAEQHKKENGVVQQVTNAYQPDENGNITLVLKDKETNILDGFTQTSTNPSTLEEKDIKKTRKIKTIVQEVTDGQVESNVATLASENEEVRVTPMDVSRRSFSRGETELPIEVDPAYIYTPSFDSGFKTEVTMSGVDSAVYRYFAISNVARFSDVGRVAYIDEDIYNDGDEHNVVTAVNNTYTEAKKHTTVVSGDTNIVVDGSKTNANGGIEYTLALNPDVNLGSAGSLMINNTKYVSADGLNAGGQVISNVAAGVADTDAVNVSQLRSFKSDVDSRVNKVGAGAAALAALHPLDFDPDEKWDFAAGYGNYAGENAAAVGAFYRPNEDTMFSVAGTFGSGENMVNAGVSFKIGQGNHVSVSRVAMAKEIIELRKELEEMRSFIADGMAGRQLDLSKIQLFPDTPENHWAYDYVTTLAGNGLLEGYPDGEFKGDRVLTRYEVAAMLYRAMMNGAKLTAQALGEFAPELDRIRVDTITKTKDGKPDIQRVRTIPGRE